MRRLLVFILMALDLVALVPCYSLFRRLITPRSAEDLLLTGHETPRLKNSCCVDLFLQALTKRFGLAARSMSLRRK